MSRSTSGRSRSRSLVVFLICIAAADDAYGDLRARLHASGFTSPVGFVQDPTDRTVQFVIEQQGRVRVVQNGVLLPTSFLDVQNAVAFGGERGLLGLAFAPDYATSGRFFVNFTNTAGDTVVARFVRSGNPLVADPSSRFDLRWGGAGGPAFIAQPFANHNGGDLVFGPDGFLYIGLGDGGSGNDPGNRAQTPSEWLGKMLRIDVNVPDANPSGYQVPSTNPFLSGGPVGTRPEIWSFGLRNPWRYSFDDPAHGGTGALIIADVGQNNWEEVDYEPPNRGGRNYGWRYREGAHDNVTSIPPAFQPLVDPVHEYDHNTGVAIMGGFVYRGHALGPAYHGRYFFADLSGRVWSIAFTIDQAGEAHASNLIEHTAALGGSQLGTITSFGVDADGELYIVSYGTGKIFKVLGPGLTGDFDGDAIADLAVFRASTGAWHVLKSSTNHTTSQSFSWGLSTDTAVPGDYDGDGTIDPAIYRPSTGLWAVLKSSTNYTTSFTVSWGLNTDVPVPGDYDGDGRTDPAVFRPSTGSWFVLQSSANYTTSLGVSWGLSTDMPLPADYDGDGKVDPAIYRPSTGLWAVLKSSTNYATSLTVPWGLSTDVAVPGDYDGDGKVDPAVYRPSTGSWYLLQSSTNYTTSVGASWGLSTDVPTPGDYDGDRRTDPAIFRPSTGLWAILKSSTNYTSSIVVSWGLITDTPINRRP